MVNTPTNNRRNVTDWYGFLDNSWIPDARRLTHELAEMTRHFQLNSMLTEQQIREYTGKIESLREKLANVEDNLNIVMLREYVKSDK